MQSERFENFQRCHWMQMAFGSIRPVVFGDRLQMLQIKMLSVIMHRFRPHQHFRFLITNGEYSFETIKRKKIWKWEKFTHRANEEEKFQFTFFFFFWIEQLNDWAKKAIHLRTNCASTVCEMNSTDKTLVRRDAKVVCDYYSVIVFFSFFTKSWFPGDNFAQQRVSHLSVVLMWRRALARYSFALTLKFVQSDKFAVPFGYFHEKYAFEYSIVTLLIFHTRVCLLARCVHVCCQWNTTNTQIWNQNDFRKI